MSQHLPATFGFATPSSFGADATTFGPQFRARWVCSNERYHELDRRQAYYDCSQHDWKQFDFDGRIIKPGPPTQQPLLVSEQSGQYVPLKARRPSSPYRLARTVVNSFTNLVFGESRFPQIRVDGSVETQDFVQTLAKLSSLPVRMTQARNLGGALGSVGLSWCFHNGKPRVLVHNAKHLHVHKWADRDDLIPEHVTEVYYFSDDVFDREKAQYVRSWFWYRRDWTPEADIVFKPIAYKADKDPQWIIDEAKTVRHDDGFCHFVWIQNSPTDEVDGLPDYTGLYENFDSIDTVLSVLHRGTVLNLDPTLVLKMDMDYVSRVGIKKGSDNALVVGETGSAEYLEIGGSSAQAGISLFESMRKNALEVAQCVIPDPNTITAAGTSSVALKMIYAPMLARCDMLRDQYGEAIRRLLDQMLRVAKAKVGAMTVDGEEIALDLPPRIEKIPVLDEAGEPTEELKIVKTARTPGDGGFIDMKWGPYFFPTADDQSKTVMTLQMATGGKAFLSKETAVEVVSSAFGLSAEEEVRRVGVQAQVDKAAQAAMFPEDMGGGVANGELPPGALPRDEPAPADGAAPPDTGETAPGGELTPAGAATLKLTASDMAGIVTVNEGRQSTGLGILLKPDGSHDPDGDLTIAEFRELRAAKGAVVGKVSGEEETGTEAAPPPKE